LIKNAPVQAGYSLKSLLLALMRPLESPPGGGLCRWILTLYMGLFLESITGYCVLWRRGELL